ncbi:MAG TPA: hypothetical protein VGQ15_16170 [Gaiellaceae bacterium]|nr:hypothetical protein [Gaiellaceae bacterium]
MAGGLSVCCLTAGREPARTAAALRLIRPVADEVVIAVDDRAEAALPRLAAVADRLLTFPFAEPGDRPIAWLFGECRGPWILNVDDDEVPGPGLVAALPAVIAEAGLTHAWIARRWLYPDVATFLDEPPWGGEYQLRLVRGDSALLQFSDDFHRPVVTQGPARYVAEPLWHLDTAVNSFQRRRAKALQYERERRGMRIASLSHNSGLYLPELRPGTRTAPVPPEDLAAIRAVLEAEETAAPAPAVERATRSQVDAHWPGPPWPEALYEARLDIVDPPPFLVAGVPQAIAVRVENRSDRVWRWGREGRPEIRVSYRWSGGGGEELRTPLPSDLPPGESLVVPVDVLPPDQPGGRTLEIDLIHEHVRWFGRPVRVEVELRARRRVAVAGRGPALERVLDTLFETPELEPFVLLPGDEPVPGLGDLPQRPGLRAYLVGTKRPQALPRALWRTGRLLAAPRRFLPALAGCELLIVAGPDWDREAPVSRELLRLAATVAAARRLGAQVAFAGDPAPEVRGAVDRLLRAAILRLGNGRAAGAEAAAALSRYG